MSNTVENVVFGTLGILVIFFSFFGLFTALSNVFNGADKVSTHCVDGYEYIKIIKDEYTSLKPVLEGNLRVECYINGE